MTSHFFSPDRFGPAALPLVVPLLLALALLSFLIAVCSWGTLPAAVLLPEAGAEFVARSSARAEAGHENHARPERPAPAGRPAPIGQTR